MVLSRLGGGGHALPLGLVLLEEWAPNFNLNKTTRRLLWGAFLRFPLNWALLLDGSSLPSVTPPEEAMSVISPCS